MSITRTISIALALTFAVTGAVKGTAYGQFEDDDETPAKKAPPPNKTPDTAGGDEAEKAPPKAPPKRPAPKPPTAEELEQAKAAYIEGQRLIDEDKNFDGAVKQFKLSYRLSRNPLLLYNIALALESAKQKSIAVFYYRKFLKDAPEGAPNRDLASERLAVLEKESEAEDLKLGTASDKPAKKDRPVKKQPKKQPKKVGAFQHVVVEEAPPGKPLDITAFIPEGAKWQVNVFYRGQGASKFTSVAMRTRYSEMVGRIPPAALQGTNLQYYVEARDPSGKVIARSGRSTSPHLIFIDPKARPRYYPDLNEGGSDGLGGDTNRRFDTGGDSSSGGIDQPTDLEKKLRWGVTATAGGSLALSITFYFIAADAASTLEGEAFQSTNESCQMGNPCRSFSDDQKSLQSRGQTFETLSNVFFFTGIVAAGGAGYLWYREMQAQKRGNSDKPKTVTGPRVIAVPMIGRDFVGGGATVRF